MLWTLMMAGAKPLLVSTSSSTLPSLMARMLDALDVHDGHRVLEIGTCRRIASGHSSTASIGGDRRRTMLLC